MWSPGRSRHRAWGPPLTGRADRARPADRAAGKRHGVVVPDGGRPHGVAPTARRERGPNGCPDPALAPESSAFGIVQGLLRDRRVVEIAEEVDLDLRSLDGTLHR